MRISKKQFFKDLNYSKNTFVGFECRDVKEGVLILSFLIDAAQRYANAKHENPKESFRADLDTRIAKLSFADFVAEFRFKVADFKKPY